MRNWLVVMLVVFVATFCFNVADAEIVSPEIQHLVSWAQAHGVISQVLVRQTNIAGASVASYATNDKSIAVVAGSTDGADRALMHELTHAFLRYEKSKLAKLANENLMLVGKLALPTKINTWPYEFKFNSTMYELAYAERTNMIANVRSAIPSGETWSGVTSASDGVEYADATHFHEEGFVYYLTEPYGDAQNRHKRGTAYGMFLRGKGVPMDVVVPVVERLRALDASANRVSGGDADVYKLRYDFGQKLPESIITQLRELGMIE